MKITIEHGDLKTEVDIGDIYSDKGDGNSYLCGYKKGYIIEIIEKTFDKFNETLETSLGLIHLRVDKIEPTDDLKEKMKDVILEEGSECPNCHKANLEISKHYIDQHETLICPSCHGTYCIGEQ